MIDFSICKGCLGVNNYELPDAQTEVTYFPMRCPSMRF